MIDKATGRLIGRNKTNRAKKILFSANRTFNEWKDINKETKRERAVCPDWAIYCTMGNILKPVVTIILPKSPTFLGNFCKGAEIFHFSSEIILDNF